MALVFLLAGCAQAMPQPAATQPPPPAVQEIILATITSTEDSGLLDALNPAFESQTGYLLKTGAGRREPGSAH